MSYEIRVVLKDKYLVRYRYLVERHWEKNETLCMALVGGGSVEIPVGSLVYYRVLDERSGVPERIAEKLQRDDLSNPTTQRVVENIQEIEMLLWLVPGGRRVAVGMALLRFLLLTIRDMRKRLST